MVRMEATEEDDFAVNIYSYGFQFLTLIFNVSIYHLNLVIRSNCNENIHIEFILFQNKVT